MYKRVEIQQLEEYFLPLSSRRERGIFAYRVNDYNEEVKSFLLRYLEAARTCGIVIEKLQNPDEKQLAYYSEIMGIQFCMDKQFFGKSLQKWLPRLDDKSRAHIVESLYHTLDKMRVAGKNENILKNAYIKFMCWLYYRFERILKQLGQENVPKILYEGEISNYEWKMLNIIVQAGCDVVLVQRKGDSAYLAIDPTAEESKLYVTDKKGAFPEDFSIRALQKESERRARLSMLYDQKLTKICSTNTWMTGEILEDALKDAAQRGAEDHIYNLFAKCTGVEDKALYCGELFRWKEKLESAGRKVIVFEELPAPTTDEIAKINKKEYSDIMQLIVDLTNQIRCPFDKNVENQAKWAFMERILEEAEKEPLMKVKNKAIYLLCWFGRYYKNFFQKSSSHSPNVLVFFQVCKNQFEALFLRFLAGMPLDIVILQPDLSQNDCLEDPRLFEKKYQNTMSLAKFPLNPDDVRYGTVAYHAEQELEDTLYQDSGLFRNQQYKTATAISLQTMYEELYLLWDQEAKYRPNFDILDEKVILPVLSAKISGVKENDVQAYWKDIRKLVVEDTAIIKNIPFMNGNLKVSAQSLTSFLKNRKLDREKIKGHSSYPYLIFREDIQEYMLDKLQELLDSEWIKGTYSQGVEYTILAVMLSLDKEITRLIQKMDFTKKIPKLLVLCTGEQMCSLEDSIMMAYLHLLGFDIAMFVPTGYQVIEKYYTKPLFVEYQIGEYCYDLRIPDLKKAAVGSQTRENIFSKLFRRGR